MKTMARVIHFQIGSRTACCYSPKSQRWVRTADRAKVTCLLCLKHISPLTEEKEK